MGKCGFGIVVTFALFLVCCTPQKRIARIVKHHPEVITTDTITINDTVVINRVQTDTILEIEYLQTDTATIAAGNAQAQISIDNSSEKPKIKLSVVQIPDTVILTKTIYTPQIKVQTVEKPLSGWKRFLCGTGGLFWCAVLMAVGVAIVKKYILKIK